jgi:hypothetical protein
MASCKALVRDVAVLYRMASDLRAEDSVSSIKEAANVLIHKHFMHASLRWDVDMMHNYLVQKDEESAVKKYNVIVDKMLLAVIEECGK